MQLASVNDIQKLFTPFASEIDVAETTELVPGDLVFDNWDKSDFELVSPNNGAVEEPYIM